MLTALQHSVSMHGSWALHLNSEKAWVAKHIPLSMLPADTGLQLYTLRTMSHVLHSWWLLSCLPMLMHCIAQSIPFLPGWPPVRGPLFSLREPQSALLQANRHLAGCKLAGHCKECNV